MKIIERIKKARGSRAVSDWERKAGIARGNLDRALKEGKLSEDNIRRLCRTENLCFNWLLEGKGPAYQVSTFHSDIALSERLAAHYIDEADSWTLTVIIRASDNSPCAVVLTMPGEQPVVMVGYTILEVLSGPFGLNSLSVVQREGWGDRQQLILADAIADSLCNGELGTYALLDTPGYLTEALPLDDTALKTGKLCEEAALNNSNPVPLSIPEQQLLAAYQSLTQTDRQRLLTIAKALKEFTDTI